MVMHRQKFQASYIASFQLVMSKLKYLENENVKWS